MNKVILFDWYVENEYDEKRTGLMAHSHRYICVIEKKERNLAFEPVIDEVDLTISIDVLIDQRC
jgi:hypothetical protein